MGSSAEICSLMENSIKGWAFIGIDAIGNSSGFITDWHDSISVISIFGVSFGVLLEFNSKGLNKTFKVINAYGPYVDKRPYWDKLFRSEAVLGPNLIVGRDRNFTLNHGELWGSIARMDPLSNHFIQELESTGLVDLERVEIKPTWVNNSVDHVVVFKRLDCFLLHNQLLQGGRIRTLVDKIHISDHFPIFLEFN